MRMRLISLGGLVCVVALAFVGSSTRTASARIDRASVDSGWGTASIDGVMSNGEWSKAQTVPFSVGNGSASDAMLYFMNDSTNLYVAVKNSPALGQKIQFGVWFDAGDQGASNEDGFSMQAHPTRLTDEYRCGTTRGWCLDDRLDGHGVVSGDGSVVELSHPLSSGDPQDFQLSAASRSQINFAAFLSVGDTSEACLPVCDLSVNSVGSWRRLTLASPPTSTSPPAAKKPSKPTKPTKPPARRKAVLTLGPYVPGTVNGRIPTAPVTYKAGVKATWRYPDGSARSVSTSDLLRTNCLAYIPGRAPLTAFGVNPQVGASAGYVICKWHIPKEASGRAVSFLFRIHAGNQVKDRRSSVRFR